MAGNAATAKEKYDNAGLAPVFFFHRLLNCTAAMFSPQFPTY